MKLLKRILLATDFGSAARNAQSTAVQIAQTFGAEIVPLHVIPGTGDLPPGADWREVERAARQELEQLTARLRSAGVTVGDSVVDTGSAYARIIDQANLLDVNVILLGSGEQEGEVGCTAEQVARRSKKPVWVVKGGAQPAVRRILCPFDFSAHSQRALSNAIHLARRFEAQLRVLHVLERLSYALAKTSGTAATAAEEQAAQKLARLKEAVAACDAHGVEVEYDLREGKPDTQIALAADEFDADLLLMGSAGRTGLSQLFLGSVATKVLRHLPCSVITVKAEQAIRAEFESDEESEAASTSHYERAQELLRHGFAHEAIGELRLYLARHPMSHEAFDLLAEASDRLGRAEEARSFRDEAEHIRRTVEQRKIEAEVRRQHPLWRS